MYKNWEGVSRVEVGVSRVEVGVSPTSPFL